MTDVELYIEKNKMLSERFEKVLPFDFYRDVFPEGSFERAGHPEDEKANGVITVIEKDFAKNHIVFDDLAAINELQGVEFAVMSPVSYSGRNRTAQNARWLYGITIDLDGVELPQLRDVLYQMQNKVIPQCTYCINSGHGLHLYYLFEKPIPLYKHLQDRFRDFKYNLISGIWNRFTSTYTERDEVQYQGIFQGFRLVGSQSKLGKDFPVVAFRTGKKTSVEYLNEFVSDEFRVTDFSYQSDLTLPEAKKKYPEWYQERIVEGKRKGRWTVKRDLYDWWLRKIKDKTNGARVGHRYSCLSVLAAYGVKCDIDEDEVLNDALSLLPFLDEMSDDEHNRFTKRDVLDAMNLYQESYVNFPRAEAERVSGISIPANKRNGRKQEIHIKYMNNQRAFKVELGECTNGGRPKGSGTAAEKVRAWREEHPVGKKIECERETGLSRHTVLKWWDNKPSDDEKIIDVDDINLDFIKTDENGYMIISDDFLPTSE